MRELKRLAEELTAEITTIEDEIKACMGEQEKITAGEYKKSDGQGLQAPDSILRPLKRQCLS